MKNKLILSILLALTLLTGLAGAHDSGKLFDRVVNALEKQYYDREFREQELPDLAARFRPRAMNAASLDEERKVVHDFLSNIPASHLAILSSSTYEKMVYDLMNRRAATLGFCLVKGNGGLFVDNVLDKGPASEAGLLRGDRIVEIDGVPAEKSRRLDWRSDDAFLPDPPVHLLLCKKGETVSLLVERRPGVFHETEVTVQKYSGFEAAWAGRKIYVCNGKRYGYIHFWMIHNDGLVDLLDESCKGPFAGCDGLVLDLRGRGGSGSEVFRLVSLLREKWHPRPLTVLIDSGTRSAKEVFAYQVREELKGLIVGEKTAGAVVPASFRQVGQGTILMYPAFTITGHTDRLEGRGVAPDIFVPDKGPYSEGADPILEAGLRALVRGLCHAY